MCIVYGVFVCNSAMIHQHVATYVFSCLFCGGAQQIYSTINLQTSQLAHMLRRSLRQMWRSCPPSPHYARWWKCIQMMMMLIQGHWWIWRGWCCLKRGTFRTNILIRYFKVQLANVTQCFEKRILMSRCQMYHIWLMAMCLWSVPNCWLPRRVRKMLSPRPRPRPRRKPRPRPRPNPNPRPIPKPRWRPKPRWQRQMWRQHIICWFYFQQESPN